MPMTYTVVRRNVDVVAEGGYQREITRIVFDFTTNDTTTATTREHFTGEVLRICTIPTQAAAGWDAYIYDDDNLDVANGQAINRSATLPEQVHPSLGGAGGTLAISNTNLRCVVANCNQGAEGQVIVYIV